MEIIIKKLVTIALLCLHLVAEEEHVFETLEVHESTDSMNTISKKSDVLSLNAKGETLGDYLKDEQFLQSATYGPAIGRPVIKGLDGFRLGINNGSIAQNDVSAMSSDHAVAMMPKIVQSIELIKGPSALLYGNKSAGVIVNKSEEHIDHLLEKGFTANVEAATGTNGMATLFGEKSGYSNGTSSIFAAHYTNFAEAYYDGNGNLIDNSDSLSSQTHTVVGHQFSSNHLLKAYADSLIKEYGIPNGNSYRSAIDMQQQRYGAVLHSKDFLGATSMQNEIQYSDYLHTEYEAGSPDGLFSQSVVSLSNQASFNTDDTEIETSIQYNTNDYKVCHDHGDCDEFTLAERTSLTDGASLQQSIDDYGLPFSHGHPMPWLKEDHLKLAAVSKQLIDETYALDYALRGELRHVLPNSDNVQEEWLVPESYDEGYYDEREDTAVSASVALYGEYNLISMQSTLSYIQRVPATSELYWNGYHHVTNTYIIGDRFLDNESSRNLDVSWTTNSENMPTKLSTYYYDFDNFIFQKRLVGVQDPFHGRDVYQETGEQAKLYGLALKQTFKQSEKITHEVSFEAIRGILDNGENIPRMTPNKVRLSSQLKKEHYEGVIELLVMDKSRYLGLDETTTPAYHSLNLSAHYHIETSYGEYKIYLKAQNLTNEQQYNHISFLKESAPLPGRQFSIGLVVNLK
jgi:iron complex outermembrane recepter protein